MDWYNSKNVRKIKVHDRKVLIDEEDVRWRWEEGYLRISLNVKFPGKN